MKRILQNGILLLASALLTVAAAELFVRLFIPVRNVGPTFSAFDPYYGKVLKRSFACTRIAPEFTMEFRTNSYGHRGPEPPSFPAHPILFLGDSFTSGYGVNDGEEFPDLLRKALEHEGPPHIPVVNAGSGNTGNGYWLRFLKNEGPRYDPRLVVLGFCVNDFSDNLVEGMYMLTEAGELREDTSSRYQQGPRAAQEVIEAVPGLAYSHLVGLARQAYSERAPSEPGGEAQNVLRNTGGRDELTYRLVAETLDLCHSRQWRVVVIAIETTGNRLDRLRELCDRRNTPLLVPPTKAERPDLYYVVDGHWNAAGHKHVHTMLMQLVNSDSLLSL